MARVEPAVDSRDVVGADARGERVGQFERVEEAGGDIRWSRFAGGLHEPMGLRIENGRILVFDRNGITRLNDRDGNGEADSELSRNSLLASGVPGTVSGFWHAHQKFGQLPWNRLLEPAIAMARDGIVVTRDLAAQLERRRELMERWTKYMGAEL